MDKNNKNKGNIIRSIICALLLLGVWLLYSGSYKVFVEGSDKILTIGVFSDSYWDVQNGYSYRILEDAVAVFNKEHPDVRVEYVSGILKEDYSEWLSEQLLSGSAPDLFFILSGDFSILVEAGALKDLTALIDGDAEFDSDRFYSSAYEYGQYNGIQYSLPYECAPKLMFVNKSIMDKEGLEIPNEDWSWEDFYRICEKVTKDTDKNGVIDQYGVVGYSWEDAFDSNGVQLFNEEGTECYFADDKVEKSLTFIEKMRKLNNGYATTKDFDLGNVVFQPMSFSEFRAYKPYPLSIKKYSSFEWGCISMPAGPDGENISTLDTLSIGMNAHTRNEGLAWDFMKVLTADSRIQSEIFDYSEGVSVLRGVTESEKTLELLLESAGSSNHLNMEILSDVVDKAVVAPRFKNYDEVIAEVDKAVDSIMGSDSNISMEQIIWNRAINKYLKN